MNRNKNHHFNRRNRHNNEMKKKISKKVEQCLNKKFYKEYELKPS